MKTTIREYVEELPVTIDQHGLDGRLVITALNQAGFDCTRVDLIDLLIAVKDELPEVWAEVSPEQSSAEHDAALLERTAKEIEQGLILPNDQMMYAVQKINQKASRIRNE